LRICSRLFAGVTLITFAFWFNVSAVAQSPAENLLRAQQTWHIDCMPKGCIASVDILRGYSGEAPDPHDTNQYISVAIGVDRTTHTPTMLTFEVDPHAEQKAGVDLFFAGTSAAGTGWKSVADPAGPIHLPFRRCDETECVAAIGGGAPDKATTRLCEELVAKMQSESHLFLSYTRNGHFYQTAVSLALFKEAYQRLIALASAPPETPAKQ
jgi:hypothetical protein